MSRKFYGPGGMELKPTKAFNKNLTYVRQDMLDALKKAGYSEDDLQILAGLIAEDVNDTHELDTAGRHSNVNWWFGIEETQT